MEHRILGSKAAVFNLGIDIGVTYEILAYQILSLRFITVAKL